MAKVDTNRNLVAALAYLPFFAIFLSIVIILVERDDKFVRFHAMQSFFISLGYYVLNAFLNIFLRGGVLSIVDTFLSPLLVILVLVVWVVSMIRAYQGVVIKWPFVGEFVEKKIG